jgi:hypothetical protein
MNNCRYRIAVPKRRIFRAFAVLAWLTMLAPLTVVADSYSAGAGAPAAFLKHADMRDWLADGEHGLWIQASDLRWFYARFGGVCRGLNATNSLAFDTGASGNIGRSSAVVVPGRGRCLVQSFAASTGPPKERNAGVASEPQSQ